MPRPPCCRRVAGSPAASLWKPAGVPLGGLQQVVLALDEFEALRLADLEGQYQEEAAARMGVSRPTLGRILEAARRKVADALVHGHALRIEGGTVVCEEPRACCRWHDGQATDNQAVGEGPGRTCRRRRDRKEGPR